MKTASLRRILLATSAMIVCVPAGMAQQRLEVDLRRVDISFGSAGEQLFVHGQVPPATWMVVATLESPAGAPTRVIDRRRRLALWGGGLQYRVEGLPGLSFVCVHDPEFNGLRSGEGGIELETLDRLLAVHGITIGPRAVRQRAQVRGVSGEAVNGEEAEYVIDGFWRMQAERGVFEVRRNCIRVSPDGMYYFVMALPPTAPEGRYTLTTYFLTAHGELETAAEDLFVRRSGVVAVLSRWAFGRAVPFGVLAALSLAVVGCVAGLALRPRGGR